MGGRALFNFMWSDSFDTLKGKIRTFFKSPTNSEGMMEVFLKGWDAREEYKPDSAEIENLRRAVSLLNSMVLGGEKHSDQSLKVVKEALGR